MTAPVSPGMFRTNSGVPLPLVALPQGELLTVNIDQIPLLKDLWAPASTSSRCAWTPKRDRWVFLATLAPGCVLPLHYHTGTAEVYTFRAAGGTPSTPTSRRPRAPTCTSPAARCTPSTAPRTTPRTPLPCVDRRRADRIQRGRHASTHQRRDRHPAPDRNRVGGAGHRAGRLHPRRRRRRGQLLIGDSDHATGL